MIGFKHRDLLVPIVDVAALSFLLLLMHRRVQVDHILLVICVLVRGPGGADRLNTVGALRPDRLDQGARHAMLALAGLERLLTLCLHVVRVGHILLEVHDLGLII